MVSAPSGTRQSPGSVAVGRANHPAGPGAESGNGTVPLQPVQQAVEPSVGWTIANARRSAEPAGKPGDTRRCAWISRMFLVLAEVCGQQGAVTRRMMPATPCRACGGEWAAGKAGDNRQ